MDDMTEGRLDGLLQVHGYISEEIRDAKVERAPDNHVNGLKEARNRVEQAIYELVDEA